MIRALHEGLGIPLKALIKEPELNTQEDTAVDWGRFPIKEMINRGWLDPISAINPEAALRSFFAPLGNMQAITSLYRKTQHTRSGRKNDPYALMAWRNQVMLQAIKTPPAVPFEAGRIDDDFMKAVAHLSVLDNGPIAAKEFLFKHGISLIIEPQMAQTYLDGAALWISTTHPVIGLTLRYDRLDNFWFTLMHELAHVRLHLTEEDEYFDDLEVGDQGDPREIEADELAGEVLIPSDRWKGSGARATKTPEAVKRLATSLGIHEAIVAGRVRHEQGNYRLLNQMVGHDEVRRLFPGINWS
jgi:HTH-type transcriptional regulator/antitoxin HigA